MEFLKKTIEALSAGFRTLMPTCRQVARIQSDALDQRLAVSTRFGLWLHLLVCKWCRRYGRQIGFLRRTAHDHVDDVTESVPQKLSDEARERIKRRLQNLGE